MIKLIATDIDGTLVKDGSGEMPDELHDAIEKVLDHDVGFVAASGRSVISSRRLFNDLADRVYFASCNGTMMSLNNRLVFAEILNEKDIVDMIDDLREYKNTVLFLTGDGFMYTDSHDEEVLDWMIKGYKENITIVDDLTKYPEGVVKLCAYDKDLRSAETFRAFREKWEGTASMATAGTMWLDIYRPGVNKGTALRRLQSMLGISKEETLAFGDQQNDMELLKAAGISCAVGNALPEVKAIATYVTDSYENGGVVKVLNEFIKHKDTK